MISTNNTPIPGIFQKVVDEILYGLTSVPDTYVPAENPVYNENVPSYPYDPQRGMQLLDEAGLKKDAQGVRLRLQIDYLPNTADNSQTIAEYLRPQLKKIGIERMQTPWDPQIAGAAGAAGDGLDGRHVFIADDEAPALLVGEGGHQHHRGRGARNLGLPRRLGGRRRKEKGSLLHPQRRF